MEQHYIGTAHAVFSHRPADLASSSFVRKCLLALAARPARRRRRKRQHLACAAITREIRFYNAFLGRYEATQWHRCGSQPSRSANISQFSTKTRHNRPGRGLCSRWGLRPFFALCPGPVPLGAPASGGDSRCSEGASSPQGRREERVDENVPDKNRKTCYQPPTLGHHARIDEASDVVLNKSALIASLPC